MFIKPLKSKVLPCHMWRGVRLSKYTKRLSNIFLKLNQIWFKLSANPRNVEFLFFSFTCVEGRVHPTDAKHF